MQGTFADQLGQQVLVELLANIILVALIVLVFAVATRFTWRKQLKNFLGMKRTGPASVHILLSNLYVKKQGTLSFNMTRVGYFGYAISESEYRYAQLLANSLQTRTFGRFLNVLGERLSDARTDRNIVTRIYGSPRYIVTDEGGQETPRMPDEDIKSLLSKDQTLILVGSPLYNALVDYVLNHAGRHSHFTYYRPEPGPENIGYAVSARPYGESGDEQSFYRGRITDETSEKHNYFREFAFVQKIHDPDLWTARVFVCAGTSSASTTAALEFLSDWKKLYKDFGEESFSVLLEVITPEREVPIPDNYQRPEGWEVKESWRYRD